MKIESNTKGIFERMRDGVIFDSPTTFITEFFQNSQRANAKNIFITLDGCSLTIKDDGCGLKNPKHLLTFNESSWKSTNEGFGLGFWSALAIPDLQEIKVHSKKHNILIDIEKASKNLEVDVFKNEESYKGFKVSLVSSYFLENEYELYYKIKEEGKTIPINIFLNGELIEKKNIFESVYGDYKKSYNTKYFKAVFSIKDSNYISPDLYYEYRYVTKLYDINFVSGVIDIKKGALDLKAPDRKTYIYNTKLENFLAEIEKCVKDLYKSFISEPEFINELHLYENAIIHHLSPKEYEKVLLVDSIKKTKSITIEKQDNFQQSFDETIKTLNSLTDNGEWIIKKLDSKKEPDIIDISNLERLDINTISKEEIIKSDSICIGETTLIKIKEESVNKNIIEEKDELKNANNTQNTSNIYEEVALEEDRTCENISYLTKKHIHKKYTIKDLIRSNKSLVWVEAREVSYYSDAISMAEYNNLTVFIAENKLFETYLRDAKVPHISNLESATIEKREFKNLNPKSKKEECFLKILHKICSLYKLDKNTFKIGDIESNTKIIYNGKVLLDKTLKNTSKKIEIFATCTERDIILDRKALDLKSFNISMDRVEKLGKHELMALMYNLNTIAHELAHFLYKTIDNTKEHTRCERLITDEILNMLKSQI